MTAQRFTVDQGERVMVVAGRKKDYISWVEKHPQIKDSIFFAFEDENTRRDFIPTDIKGLLFDRKLDHPDHNRLKELAKKNGVHYTRFFPRSIELKSFLEMSILIDKKPIGIHSEIEGPKEATMEIVMDKKDEKVVLVKRKKGDVKNFILTNADFQPAVVKDEIQRLLELSKEKNLGMTNSSVRNAYYGAKKEKSIPSVKRNKKKKKEKSSVSVLAEYVDSVRQFTGLSEIAAVAIKEILENQAEIETERELWTMERADLLKQIETLKKEANKSKTALKKQFTEFFKNM